MGMQNVSIQDEFTLGEAPSGDSHLTQSAASTVSYITDLLSELQMIANVSGQADLSDDIRIVILKHMSRSAKV